MGKAKRRQLGRKKESQPRLAALGSPFQGKGLVWTLPPSYGRRCPKGAEVGWGKRYERERGDRLKCVVYESTLSTADAVPLPRWGRQRGGGFAAKRKPTPPRCARQPLPREGAREVIPSFLWKEVPRRGGGWMGMPLSPKQRLPRGRRGAVSISHSQISIYP